MKKFILITGCSSGIGLASALRLKELGYDVIATARTKSDLEFLEVNGIISVMMDVGDYESIDRAMELIAKITNKNLFAIFLNSGYGLAGAIEDLPVQAVEHQMRVNVFGAHHINTKVIPWMRENGQGRIIFNSSVLGFLAMPYRGAYAASKFMMEAIADAMRLELHGVIHVSLIEPGPIATNFRKNSLNALLKWVNVKESFHREKYEKLIARLGAKNSTSRHTLQASACVDALVHAIDSKNPKHRYKVTNATKISWILKHLLPSFILDRIVSKWI